MNATTSVQQATRSDTNQIANFLSHAALIHRHLDWQGVLDWIPHKPFLLLRQDDQLNGVLVCPPDQGDIAWIRCFAASRYPKMREIWALLFHAACKAAELSEKTLYSVGLNDWFAQLLADFGFINFQNIVVLLWNRRYPEQKARFNPWQIRPMTASDLPQVAALDSASFEPMWINPLDKLTLAYNQSEHASVAELDDEIIGYEMTTANHFSAHLARIAVHPKHQKQQIGSTLVTEMLKYFTRKGIDQITVNTQNNNTSSLALYQNLGFELTGETFPVFRSKVISFEAKTQ